MFARYRKRIDDYRARRPHHSFRLTRRRDLPKTPPLAGVIGFTASVFRQLWGDKVLFGRLLAFVAIVAFLLVGLAQQSQYTASTETLKEYNKLAADQGVNGVTRIGVLFASTISGGLNTDFTESQQASLFALYLLAWLVTIWLLRHRLAGTVIRLRDGLYNAGAPIVSTLALLGLMMLQLVPGALGILVFAAASSSGLLMGGIEVGLFAFVAVLLVILSLYFVSSTFFAIIIATIPGTYPMKALRSASEMVIGQRARLIVRLAWLFFILAVLWVAVLLPVIVLDSWLAQSWLPLVVLTVQLLTGFSVIFGSAYIYLLYRKMIDEPVN